MTERRVLERGDAVVHEDCPLTDEELESLFPDSDIHRIRRMTPEERLEMHELERVSTHG